MINKESKQKERRGSGREEGEEKEKRQRNGWRMEIIEHNSVDYTRLHWTRIEQTFQKQFDLIRVNIVSHIFKKLYAHKAKLFFLLWVAI